MNKEKVRFDQFARSVQLGNWLYDLQVENQNEQSKIPATELKDQYLKVTLSLSNTKTKQSLLYSASKDGADYEAKYKYLSFGSGEDIYIKYKDEYIYPLGYVFEPSNGLSRSDRLVYKFCVKEDLFQQMSGDDDAVEYWYIDRMLGLGKICFKQQ